MNFSLPKLDRTAALIAFKSCLAVVLFMAIALPLNWKPSFGLIIIVVLQTAILGKTLKKGIMYLAGTLGGASVALVLIALFAHDRGAFILAVALLTIFSAYRQQMSRYPYAWLIFTVTFILVGFFSHKAFEFSFQIAIWRASPVSLAIVVVFLVDGIFWPFRAGKTFERQLHGFLEGCRGSLSLMSRALAGDEPDPDALEKAGTAQVKALAALRGTLDAAASDTERFNRYRAGYEELIDHLHDLQVALLTLRDSMRSRPDAEGEKSSAGTMEGLDDIRSLLATVEGKMEELVRDLARPRDGTAGSRPSDAGFDQPATIASPFAAMLAGSLRDLAGQVSKVRATLAGIEDPGQVPLPRPAPPREPFSLTSVKFRKAAAGGLVMLLAGWFFIQTQWPMGLTLGMVFASIVVTFSVMVPLIMVGRQLLFSLVIGSAISAPLYFVIMPRINQFQELIPWLLVAFAPLFYLMASKPQKLLQYLFAAIFVAALPSYAEEGQAYSLHAFETMWFGFFGGFAGALAIYSLFSSVVPEREFWKQVRSFFAGCGQSMQNLAVDPPWTPAGAAMVKADRKRWPGLFKHLQMWSGVVDYNRVPGRDRQATRALIGSIQYTALRLDAVEQARRQFAGATDESQREPLQRLYDTCVESFQVIASSVGDLKAVPALPDTGSLVRDLESKGEDLRRSAAGDEDARASAHRFMNVTAHLGSLADAIHDCRDKANALDWEAWNRNYF